MSEVINFPSDRIRSKPYHIHVVATKPYVFGEPKDQVYRKLEVHAPVYGREQVHEHPAHEWIEFTTENHPEVRELKDQGYTMLQSIGTHTHQSHLGEKSAREIMGMREQPQNEGLLNKVKDIIF